MPKSEQEEEAGKREADRRLYSALRLWAYCPSRRCRRSRGCMSDDSVSPYCSALDAEDFAWLWGAIAAARANGSKDEALSGGERAREQYLMNQEMGQLVRDAASLLQAHIAETIRLRFPRRRSGAVLHKAPRGDGAW